MNHYFTNNADLKDNIKQLDVQLLGTSFRFYTNSGVFSKDAIDYGSKVLIQNIKIFDNVKNVLDMGCGYGPIGITLAKVYNVEVLMADINERAIKLAEQNIELNNIKKATTIVSDLFSKITTNFDMIVTNPPIRTGKQNIFNLYKQAFDYLNDDGFLYVVIQKKQGAQSTVKYLESLFKEVQVITKEKGYWIILATK